MARQAATTLAGNSESKGGTVDFAYLCGVTASDPDVMDEVLTLFRQQAQIWATDLADNSPGWRQVVHTIKGAARGIGAFQLGDACERAEEEETAMLSGVRSALAEAIAEIEAYQAGVLSRSQTSNS